MRCGAVYTDSNCTLILFYEPGRLFPVSETKGEEKEMPDLYHMLEHNNLFCKEQESKLFIFNWRYRIILKWTRAGKFRSTSKEYFFLLRFRKNGIAYKQFWRNK